MAVACSRGFWEVRLGLFRPVWDLLDVASALGTPPRDAGGGVWMPLGLPEGSNRRRWLKSLPAVFT